MASAKNSTIFLSKMSCREILSKRAFLALRQIYVTTLRHIRTQQY